MKSIYMFTIMFLVSSIGYSSSCTSKEFFNFFKEHNTLWIGDRTAETSRQRSRFEFYEVGLSEDESAASLYRITGSPYEEYTYKREFTKSDDLVMAGDQVVKISRCELNHIEMSFQRGRTFIEEGYKVEDKILHGKMSYRFPNGIAMEFSLRAQRVEE